MTDAPASETPADSQEPNSAGAVRPVIIERPMRSAGQGLIWLIPVAALVVSVWIAISAWSDRGPRIVVEFSEVHGLEAGDVVRCRGVEIGRVEGVGWSERGETAEGARSIRVSVTIRADASDLIRSGARFWIARPEFGYGGVRGLETVVGPRYLAMSPGTGKIDPGPFAGLQETPIDWVDRVDDLEIVIESSERRGMRRGGMVTYRGLPAGRILQVELASDASQVEARVVIDRRHATLIREATRFFSTSGVSFEFGLDGLRADVESIESLVAGGIAFATPPDAGERAPTGSRFVLAPRAEDAWIEWRPRIALGGHALGRPSSVRASLRWTGGIFGTSRSRSGWITRLDDQFVAIPTSLLSPPADVEDAKLEFAGTSIPIDPFVRESEDPSEEVRILRTESLPGLPVATFGPNSDFDVADPPGSATLLVHLGDDLGPTPVSAGRWRYRNGVILIDAAVVFADEEVGAPVTHAGTGALIGFLILDPDGIRVGRLPPGFPN